MTRAPAAGVKHTRIEHAPNRAVRDGIVDHDMEEPYTAGGRLGSAPRSYGDKETEGHGPHINKGPKSPPNEAQN